MDIEKAKKTCKAYINAIDTFGTIDYKCINNLYEPIDAVLSELEKKDEYIKMLTDERDTLIKERDYYKARYNEFNNAFIKTKEKE